MAKATEKATERDDFFSEENQVAVKGNPYFNLENVGDVCRGYLIRKSVREDMNKEGQFQRVYTICVPEGEEYDAVISAKEGKTKVKGGELMDVYGRMPIEEEGRVIKICAGVDNLPLGIMVGFKYTHDEKGDYKYPAKIMTAYKGKEIRKDILAKFVGQEMTEADDATAKGEAF